MAPVIRALAEVCDVLGDAGNLRREGEEARVLRGSLVGRPIPSVVLTGYEGELFDLAKYVATPSVVYVYPGAPCSPNGGEVSAGLDGAQHRGYMMFWQTFFMMKVKRLGVSSPPWQQLCASYDTDHVRHLLWSDPEFLMAEALGLPTFEADGVRWYRRLTMVILKGRITKVFYPVTPPMEDAQNVFDWLQSRGFKCE
jgi:peroxiredoxin